MLFQSGLTDAFRLHLLQAALTLGVFKIALYGADANLVADTPAYTPDGEVQAQNYPPGGFILTGGKADIVDGVALLEWAQPQMPPMTVEAYAALIYLEGGPSVAVLAFQEPVRSTNGPVIVPLDQCIQWGRSA